MPMMCYIRGIFWACLCNPEHPVTVIPYGHGRYEWKMQFDPDLDFVDEDYFLTFLERWINTDKLSVERTRVCDYQAGVAYAWQQGRVFLLGGAVHQFAPYTHLDTSASLQDVWNLGWKLAMVINQLTDEALLDSYESERQPLTADWMTKSAAFQQTLRGISTDNPLVAGNANGNSLHNDMLQPDYSAGFRAKGQTVTVGELFPNPKVHRCSGELVQLHQVIGNRFAVLGLNKNPVEYISAHSQWRGLWDSLDTQFIWIVEPGVTMCLSGDNFTTLKDSEGKITDWLHAHKAEFVVLRPDRYVYGVYYRDLSKAERHLIPELSIQ